MDDIHLEIKFFFKKKPWCFNIWIFWIIDVDILEVESEIPQTSEMDCFATIVDGQKQLTVVA